MCFSWLIGKIGQDGASCYGLLVVKIVVKRGMLTTKDYFQSNNNSPSG